MKTLQVVLLALAVIVWFYGFINKGPNEPSTVRVICLGLALAGLALLIPILSTIN